MRAMALRISIGSVEARPRSRWRSAANAKRRIGERQVLEVERAHGAGVAPVRLGAHEPRASSCAAGVLDAGERERRRALGLEHGDARPSAIWRQAVDEALAVNAGDAVADPDDLGSRRRHCEETLDRAEMRAAGPARCGCGFDGAQPLERRGGARAAAMLGRLVGGRHDRDDAARRAPRPRRARRQALMRSRQSCAAGKPLSTMRSSGALPVLPASGFQTGPAAARIRSAASSRRSSSSHHGVRAGVSRSGTQVGEDLQRREVDPPRLRRRDAQEQPDRRQRGERRQHQRRREGEGKAEHRQPALADALPPRAADDQGHEAQRRLARRPVGAMDGEGPAAAARQVLRSRRGAAAIRSR